MGGVEVVVEEAVALGGGEGLDLALVVGRAVDLVGRRPARQAFPLQQAGQFGVGRDDTVSLANSTVGDADSG